MKIETLKRKLITLALHEHLSLDHSEEELMRVIRTTIGKKTTRTVVWPGSDYFAPFTVEAGNTILPHFVHIPTDDKLSKLGHPFGCGPNESPDQVLYWLKWAVCVVEGNGEGELPPSPTSWTLYRLFDQEDIQEARKSCLLSHRPTYEETLFTALTLADWWPELSRKYLGKATYESITRWTCHLASLINPEKTRRCVQHLLDFGIPEIPQALAIATGAFLAGTLFGINALENSVDFLSGLEQLMKEKEIPHSSDEVTYAFHAFCAFYSLFAERHGINLALENLRQIDITKTGIRIPVITNEWGNFYTLPPACLRVTQENYLETLQTLYYWYAISNKNKYSISPLRWGSAVNKFFNTIISNLEHKNAFLDPILLAKTTARIGVGVKLASSEVIGVVELEIPGSYDDSMLRIFAHDNKQIICWAKKKDALIRGNVEGFSSIKYYNPYFI